MSANDFGTCQICGRNDFLSTKYFINKKVIPTVTTTVKHCKRCIPKEPKK